MRANRKSSEDHDYLSAVGGTSVSVWPLSVCYATYLTPPNNAQKINNRLLYDVLTLCCAYVMKKGTKLYFSVTKGSILLDTEQRFVWKEEKRPLARERYRPTPTPGC